MKRAAPEEPKESNPLFDGLDKARAFGGATYKPEHDYSRLAAQMNRVRALMLDGVWRTLEEIAIQTGDPAQSVSARLRDLRKTKHGSWEVKRRRRGEAARGVHEYRVVAP